VLAPATDAVAAYANDVREAIDHVAGAPKDVSRLHARRITRGLANLLSGAFLCEQATWELAERGSARKAALAQLYAGVHLRPRGLVSRDEAIVLELFDPITRYGEVSPDRLMAAVG
jgi:hypothetical protein